MNEQKFHIGIKALIRNAKNEVLVLKANPAELKGGTPVHWDLPGGRIEKGDSAFETLKKEVKEELGIDGNLVKVIGLFDASISNLKIPLENEVVGLALFTYLCNLSDEKAEFTLNAEHTELKWANIEEAKKLLSFKFSKEFIGKLDSLR